MSGSKKPKDQERADEFSVASVTYKTWRWLNEPSDVRYAAKTDADVARQFLTYSWSDLASTERAGFELLSKLILDQKYWSRKTEIIPESVIRRCLKLVPAPASPMKMIDLLRVNVRIQADCFSEVYKAEEEAKANAKAFAQKRAAMKIPDLYDELCALRNEVASLKEDLMRATRLIEFVRGDIQRKGHS